MMTSPTTAVKVSTLWGALLNTQKSPNKTKQMAPTTPPTLQELSLHSFARLFDSVLHMCPNVRMYLIRCYGLPRKLEARVFATARTLSHTVKLRLSTDFWWDLDKCDCYYCDQDEVWESCSTRSRLDDLKCSMYHLFTHQKLFDKLCCRNCDVHCCVDCGDTERPKRHAIDPNTGRVSLDCPCWMCNARFSEEEYQVWCRDLLPFLRPCLELSRSGFYKCHYELRVKSRPTGWKPCLE